MNSSQTQDHRLKTEADPQQVFTSYQQEFRAALERSAEALRHTIATAQQSISGQLNQSGLDQFQPTAPTIPTAPLKPTTAEVVDEAFLRAKEMLDQMERSQAGSHILQEIPLAAQKLPEMAPADPLAASEFLMSQATGSLNAAMEAVIQAMNPHPGKSETG